jgi:tetrahydromethanopterin S-methyltransferase subunit G
MEWDEQKQLHERVDEIFERSDKKLFEIMNRIAELALRDVEII